MITQEQLRELFDYRGGALYWTVSPSRNVPAGARAGCTGIEGYRQVCVRGRQYKEHRLIYLMHYGDIPDGEIDHVNGNRGDNRVENLRPCTTAQNQHNAITRSTSGVKGVCWNNLRKKWMARISVAGKRRHLGYFGDLEEAATVVGNARADLHGVFANYKVNT